jgi:hypothetical protein
VTGRLPEPGPGRPHHPGQFRRVPPAKTLERHRRAREQLQRERAEEAKGITRGRLLQRVRRALRGPFSRG